MVIIISKINDFKIYLYNTESKINLMFKNSELAFDYLIFMEKQILIKKTTTNKNINEAKQLHQGLKTSVTDLEISDFAKSEVTKYDMCKELTNTVTHEIK